MTGFQGVNAAAVTPRGQQGEVDLGAAFELIDHLSLARVDGIVLFSEHGEYPSFHIDERSRLVYLAVKRSRVPLLVGVGSATLELSIALAREAREAGAAGLLLPPPFFFRYDPDDVLEFYLRFAEQLGRGVEVFLSNTPALTSSIPVEISLALLQAGLFTGIVDSSGSMESFACLQASASKYGFRLLSGSDAILTSARCAGSGAVSAAACVAPELMMALDRAIKAKNQKEIERLDAVLREFLTWVDRFPQPTIVKVATGLRGLKTGPRPIPLSPDKESLLAEFREWFQGWLPAVKKMSANA